MLDHRGKERLHPLHTQGSGTIMEEGQKTVRAGRQEDRGQTMTAGHDRGTASINSQDLWLPAQDLQDIQPVIVLAWRQGS